MNQQNLQQSLITREPTEAATEQKVAIKPIQKPAAEATPTKYKKSKLKLLQEFMNETIADEKDTNNEIFLDYFKYQNR